MEPLLHAANMLFLCSYAARDVLWLRLLTLLGLGCVASAALAIGTPVTQPEIAWNAAFILLNAGHIGLLLAERRPIRLTEEEADLRQLTFAGLSDHQYARLIRAAAWSDVHPGGGLMAAGERSPRLLVIASGAAVVARDGVPVADLQAGDFVGEMSFLTGEAASAAVIAVAPTTCASWTADRLHTLMEADANLRAAVQGILGVDVALKLRAT